MPDLMRGLMQAAPAGPPDLMRDLMRDLMHVGPAWRLVRQFPR